MTLDPATEAFILHQFVPFAGLITGTFMTFAPFRAVLRASRDGSLGDLNPTPWIFMLGNCCGWVTYSFLLHNVWIFLGNAPGFILAIWLNIQAIKLQYENHRSTELQNKIIGALKDKQNASYFQKHKIVDREALAAMMEQTFKESNHFDIFDPATTTPIIEEGSGDTQGSSTEPSSSMTYNSTDGNDEDEAEGGNFSFGLVRNNTMVSVEFFFDYATFIWDIAAQRSPAPVSHEMMVVGISILWLTIITIVIFSQSILRESARILIVGVFVNANLIFFYGAPLSKIMTVLETRASKLIHIPTMIFSLMNGTLWFVYGLAMKDPFITVPNGFGALLGIVQAILCFIFPRHSHHRVHFDDGVLECLGSRDENSTSTDSLSLPAESTPLI